MPRSHETQTQNVTLPLSWGSYRSTDLPIYCLLDIGDLGAKAIAEAVKSSGSMATLYLLYNSNIGAAGKQSLQDAVRGRQGFNLFA